MKFKIFSTLAIAAAAALCLLVSCENNDYGYRIKDGAIVYNTPERPSDQISMIGFAADPIDTV